jgi:hypothetical protein
VGPRVGLDAVERRNNVFVGSEFSTAVTVKSIIFWDMTSCNPVEIHGEITPDYMALHPSR